MTQYYVTTVGSNINDGLSEATAWRTITYAATKAVADDIVNIKGGDYGHEHVILNNSGIANNPIVFQGYNGIPVINGQDMTGNGIYISHKSYIKLKNIEVTKYYYGIRLNYAENVTLDNVNVTILGYTGIFLEHSNNSTIINSSVTDADDVNIWLTHSHHNTVENCTSYAISTTIFTGYHIVIAYGHDNVIKHCLAENNHASVNGGGHGIGIKDNYITGYGYDGEHSYNNKIIDSVSRGNYESFFVAHFAHDNEIINCTAERADLMGTWNHGLVVRDGAYNNTFKNCISTGFVHGIALHATGEYPGTAISTNNTFENIIVSNVADIGIRLLAAQGTTFKNIVTTRQSFGGTLFLLSTTTGTNNIITNSIIYNFSTWSSGTGENPTSTYSNFWNNGFNTPSGTGNINSDPLFANTTNKDYHLKSMYGRWNGTQWIYTDTVTSPCLQAGNPSSNNSLSPWGGIIEMGTYGNTIEASNHQETCPTPIVTIEITQL